MPRGTRLPVRGQKERQPEWTALVAFFAPYIIAFRKVRNGKDFHE